MELKEKKNKVLVDPLLEKKNILPKFAHTLKFNHWSPTSLSLGDGPFIFRYLVLTQEERRMLPANAQMKAGVACNNATQLALANILWKFNSAKKLAPTKHIPLTKDAALQIAMEEFKEYRPGDDKDQTKAMHYIETIPQTIKQIFLGLEKLTGVSPTTSPVVTCEKHISVSDDRLLVDIIGRTDFEFGSFSGGILSPGFFLAELKTVHDRFGKLKKDGNFTLLNARLPSKPSETHLQQCAFYSRVYNYEAPIYLLYACKDDYEIFDSSNCPGLTKTGLKENYNKLVAVARRRERMLARYETMDRESILENIIADTDPNFSHPYFWNIGPEFQKRAFQLWNLE